MIIKQDISLKDFNFWAGAKDTVKYLTDEELDRIEAYLDYDVAVEFEATEINDWLWFQRDEIAEILGYEDFDKIIEERG